MVAGRGHRDAQLARLFAPRCEALSSREGSAGCRAGRRGGSAAARADSPGRSRAPIGSWRTNLRSRLALQGGVASTPGAATETLGPRLAASTKRAGGRSAARPRRAPPCGPPPLRPRSRPKTPLEHRFPPFPAPPSAPTCVGEIGFSFSKWLGSSQRFAGSGGTPQPPCTFIGIDRAGLLVPCLKDTPVISPFRAGSGASQQLPLGYSKVAHCT